MSEALPRERMSAWQRWELATLDAPPAVAADPVTAEREAAEREAAQRVLQAQAEGRAQGHAAGRAEAAAETERLRQLLTQLGEAVADREQRLADDVLDLALVFARQMVGQALSVRRELVLPIVAAALSQLPQASRHIEVRLNPADVALVRSVLPDDHAGPHVTLVPDQAVAPGGCLVDTDQAAVDATIPTRWRRLLAGLGRTDDWLEPA
ncbi:MAG TPA: flagellar assembly protein FliH [Casimicrobiaceae bacterium]|nr:flagellar assembly protein FliH [Casimicrobiaceae bacterium]